MWLTTAKTLCDPAVRHGVFVALSVQLYNEVLSLTSLLYIDAVAECVVQFIQETHTQKYRVTQKDVYP